MKSDAEWRRHVWTIQAQHEERQAALGRAHRRRVVFFALLFLVGMATVIARRLDEHGCEVVGRVLVCRARGGIILEILR